MQNEKHPMAGATLLAAEHDGPDMVCVYLLRDGNIIEGRLVYVDRQNNVSKPDL